MAVDKALALAALERHRLLFNDFDRAGWLDNFTDRPFIEEPVGSPVRYGREHFGAVMDALGAHGVKATIAPPNAAIVNGDEVAAHLTVTTVVDGTEKVSEVLEVFTIAEDGRVAGIRAFVEPETLETLE